jgi:bifunctional UDP-N-acetylglucosamine pyrophosphorylase / glucosamine-1-phosphate N-acetyltransferase
MLENVSCVILAGGVEHRFNDSTPRVLQPINGVPMVGHVLNTVESLGVDHITVVSNVREVEKFLGGRAKHIFRDGTRGSGDALYQAKSRIEEFDGDVFVIYGDRPLLKASTLEKLAEEGRKEGVTCAFLSVVLSEPHGHARVMRNETGMMFQTGRDCEIQTKDQQIREVIAGAYFFRKQALLNAFKVLRPEELGQFYVTDITTLLARKKDQVTIVQVDDPREVKGIYSVKGLAEAERYLKSRDFPDGDTVGIPLTAVRAGR